MDTRGAQGVTRKQGEGMQKLHKRLCISILFLALVAAIMLTAQIISISAERQNCICALLTDDDTLYPIDAKLDSIIDTSTLNPGTFVRINTHCRHNVSLSLTVFVDEGVYRGHILYR